VIVAAITLPWFIMVQRANPEFLHFFFVTQQVTRFLSAAEFNNPSPIWFYLPVIIAGFLPWTAFLPQALAQHVRRCWHNRHEQAAVLYLLIWALVIFVFFSIPRSKTISYILPVFPALAILVGKYIADNWQESQRSISLTMCVLQVIFINLLIAALIFALPSLWVDLPLPFTPTLLAAGSQLLVSAALLTFLLKRIRVAQLFYICSLTSALMLLTFAAGARHLSMNSAKPLVTTLQTILRPTDTVANYFKFYQDVPLYLNRKIILIADWNAPNIEQRDNWVRELWYSMPFQNTDDILLNEDSFWKRWHSSERIFVFVNKNYLEQFASHTKKFYEVGQHQDILLLCNQRVD
jgi:4-amino-4-deoxy-L-arabinose transferase-like glycosyltransferase